METTRENTQMLCKFMSELEGPSTIKQITDHATSRMQINSAAAVIAANEMKNIIKTGAKSGYIFQLGNKYSCLPIAVADANVEDQVSDQLELEVQGPGEESDGNEPNDAVSPRQSRRKAPRRAKKTMELEDDDHMSTEPAPSRKTARKRATPKRNTSKKPHTMNHEDGDHMSPAAHKKRPTSRKRTPSKKRAQSKSRSRSRSAAKPKTTRGRRAPSKSRSPAVRRRPG